MTPAAGGRRGGPREPERPGEPEGLGSGRPVAGARGAAVPVNSIKGAFGHAMGAAAALEAILCLLAGRHGQIPATLGLEERDSACDVDCLQGVPRALRPRISLSTSLGFGGCNAALVIESA